MGTMQEMVCHDFSTNIQLEDKSQDILIMNLKDV